jgi:hypothetical protein
LPKPGHRAISGQQPTAFVPSKQSDPPPWHCNRQEDPCWSDRLAQGFPDFEGSPGIVDAAFEAPADLVAARSTLTGEHLAAYVGG